MATLKQIIALLASFSLILAVLRSYLQVNKTWAVRHERSVADSVSVSSNLIGLIPATLATLDLCLSLARCDLFFARIYANHLLHNARLGLVGPQ
jgi:hypothetical protein